MAQIPLNPDSKVLWMDGEFVPYNEAMVPVLSHSLHYGCAAFEGLRVYRQKDGRSAIFRAVEHYQRFFDSMRVLGYTTPHTLSELVDATRKLVRENGFEECYVRPVAYLGDGFRGLKLPESCRASITIAVWSWGKYLGDEGAQKGIRVAVSSYRRPDISTALTWAKLSGGYLTSVLARREATRQGCDEALLLDPQGYVAEGSGENLFLVKDRVLHTPPPGSILPGITRDCVFKLARAMGYEVRESLLTRNQVYLADELFFTGTAVEVTGIREVDGHRIGDGKLGPITRALSERFFRTVRGEDDSFREWLTVV